MAARYVQANTNGRLHAAHEPSLAPLDRGFLYGDAIYEVWRTYHGVVFAWEEHWGRLERSARALHLGLPLTASRAQGEIRRTVAAFRAAQPEAGDVYIRLQISRGGGGIGLDIALADEPTFVILVQPVPLLPAHAMERGLRLSLATTLHRNAPATLDPAWKTGNYLNNILCLREARARGADEVVITSLGGEITEAAVCNLAFVAEGRVLTPPAGVGILAGITRQLLILEVAPSIGIEVEERSLWPADLPAMAECFLLSTTKDLQPVGAIDQHAYRVGADTVTRRLKDAFAAYARRYATAHPELAV